MLKLTPVDQLKNRTDRRLVHLGNLAQLDTKTGQGQTSNERASVKIGLKNIQYAKRSSLNNSQIDRGAASESQLSPMPDKTPTMAPRLSTGHGKVNVTRVRSARSSKEQEGQNVSIQIYESELNAVDQVNDLVVKGGGGLGTLAFPSSALSPHSGF